MSASGKKKARSEAASAKLTERQQAEQKEAKKMKLYTAAFCVVLAVLVVVAAWVGISRTIESSGVHQKNTVAVTVGDHKISNAELNYYYMDAVNNFNQNYGSYAFLYGLDMTKPLNEQVTNEETGATWADDFIQSAIDSAKATYALADAAEAAGYTLPEDVNAQVESISSTLDLYAQMSGYSDADGYVKAMYGNGSSKEGYLEYYKRNALAQSFYGNYSDSLTYDAAAIAAADAEDPMHYNSYSYNQYYISATRFLDDSENADEKKDAAILAAEVAAKSLITDDITSVEAFDAAIQALDINADSEASSTVYNNTLYSSVSSAVSEWVTDASRKAGDKTIIPTKTTVDDAEEVTGYYAVYFVGSTDNKLPLKNVRHILVSFESDATDEQKAAAKAEAEALLEQWKSGEATEDSFAALATENTTDTGSAANGGLYTDVYPGQMVTSFNDWCFDEARQPGDTGIVESTYGYHVMYFVGNSDVTYRDSMIEKDLRSADSTAWYDSIVNAISVTEGDTKYIRKDLVMSSGSN